MSACTRQQGILLAAGLVVSLLLILSSPAAAAAGNDATSCECKDCHIVITLKVAFFGADNNYISRFISEVQNAWNGPPDNPSTYGDCKCPFEVKVVTKSVTNCTAETEYHCIQVTNYTANPPYSGNESVLVQVRNGTIDPKTSDQVTRHRGYLYPPGTSTGAPVAGWWSDAMSTPYNGQQVTDFAHEAGHLMGLHDGSGGIMDFAGMTSGRASQGNIDQAVKNNCGANPCPDRCCCGNGVTDDKKGEKCDPLATPPGCPPGSACCPVCCNCFVPACDPENGEYATEEDCKKNCKGEGETCHINYHTGCWDCAPPWIFNFSRSYESTREAIWKADESGFHPPVPKLPNITPVMPVSTTPKTPPTAVPLRPAETIPPAAPATIRSAPADAIPPKPVNETPVSGLISSINDVPAVADFLSDERINVHLAEGEYHVTTEGGSITDSGDGSGTDPTVNVWSDEKTLRQIAGGELSFEKAVSAGRVRFEGVGVVSFLKFSISEFILKVRAAFSSGY